MWKGHARTFSLQVWHVCVFLGMAYFYWSTHNTFFYVSAFCRGNEDGGGSSSNVGGLTGASGNSNSSDLDFSGINFAAISDFLLNSVAAVWKSESMA